MILLTTEELATAREGFHQHDITQCISLIEGPGPSDEELSDCQKLMQRAKNYMTMSFPDLGINRKMMNFSDDHPVNLLVDRDAQWIAEEATKLLRDPQATSDAVEQFLNQFAPLFETAISAYCTSQGTTPDDLTDDVIEQIVGDVTNGINEELLSVLMQGQQLDELFQVAKELPAHEDFGSRHSYDSINFHNKWTHIATKLGAMLSLDDLPENMQCQTNDNDEKDYRLLRNAFLATLDETDQKIFVMRETGKTQTQIAKALGYRTHSAVAKRLQNMRKQFDCFWECTVK